MTVAILLKHHNISHNPGPSLGERSATRNLSRKTALGENNYDLPEADFWPVEGFTFR